jgi:osmoprotectant transport system permease protein
MRIRSECSIWLLLSLSLAVFISGPSKVVAEPDEGRTIGVGSKAFTESQVLGYVAKGLIEKKGFETRQRFGLGGTGFVWKALTTGEIDVYPEYTGTIKKEILSDQKIKSEEQLREALAEYGIGMTDSLGFNNTYELGMRPKQAKKLGLSDISDLQNHPSLKLGFTNEFIQRKDGLPALKKCYQLPQTNIDGLQHELAYHGLMNGSLDVIDLYSTDAEIEKYDLQILEDNRNCFTKYNAVYLYRKELEKEAPKVVEALKQVQGQLTADKMRILNAKVDIDGKSEQAVAASFIKDQFGVEMETTVETFWSRLQRRTGEHLFLVIVSMLGAIFLAIPLGIAAAKFKLIEQPLLGVVGILQTIPSLALLVFMIPLMGLGTWPAIAALFVYSLLPIVRTTHSGLKEIPSELEESARAIGMSKTSILNIVELPLASRSILAGIKTSAVINIGTATLGGFIGAGGYGQPIIAGIDKMDLSLIFEGAIPAALLAILAQMFFELLEWYIVPEGLKI